MIEIHYGLIKKSNPLYTKKIIAFKKCCCDKNNSFIKRQLNILQDRLFTLIEASKLKYYCRMTKTQLILKEIQKLSGHFLNNKKIRLFPPLFDANGFITNFKKKADLFNFPFAKQCSLIWTNGELPARSTFYTDNRLSTVRFSHEDVAKIIQNLNPNKAHRHDNISTRILKTRDSNIYKPSEIIFKEALSTVLFPSEWIKIKHRSYPAKRL